LQSCKEKLYLEETRTNGDKKQMIIAT